MNRVTGEITLKSLQAAIGGKKIETLIAEKRKTDAHTKSLQEAYDAIGETIARPSNLGMARSNRDSIEATIAALQAALRAID